MLLAVAMAATGCGRGIDEAATGVTAAPPLTTTTSSPSATTQPPTEAPQLLVWVPIRQVSAVRQAAISFTQATGIEVVIETIELDEMESAVSSAVGPDLFIGQHTWLSRIAAQGLAAPVDLEARRGEFSEVAFNAFTYRGVTYGAPITVESVAMFHNSALVPTAPGAMSEIKELCLQLRGIDTATTTTEATTTTSAPVAGPGCVEVAAADSSVILTLVRAGTGYLYRLVEGDYLADDVGIANEGALAKAEALRGLAADGVLANSPDIALMVEQFATGATPILFGDISLAEAISASGTVFGAAPLPILTGSTPQPFVDVTGFMLSGRSTRPDTALLFLNDYLLTEGTMSDLAAAAGSLPAFVAAADVVRSDTVVAGLLAAAERGVPTPTIDGIRGVVDALTPLMNEVVEAGGREVAVILGEAEAIALAAAS